MKGLISKRYCDESMAVSMGIKGNRKTNLQKCKGKCETCLACIEIGSNGNKEHVTDRGLKT